MISLVLQDTPPLPSALQKLPNQIMGQIVCCSQQWHYCQHDSHSDYRQQYRRFRLGLYSDEGCRSQARIRGHLTLHTYWVACRTRSQRMSCKNRSQPVGSDGRSGDGVHQGTGIRCGWRSADHGERSSSNSRPIQDANW